MDNTWVKLYRKIGDNSVMRDSKACQLFLWLLVHVDKKKGSFTCGRFQVSEELGLNSNTFYKVLKRLEKKYEIVTLSSNNKFTEISLLNWSKYNPYQERVTQGGNNKVTTKEQQSNTKQDIKTIDIKTFTNVNKDFGNKDINDSSKYFLEKLQIPKEDCTQQQSRRYWNLLLKESKTGLQGVKWLIDLVSKDEFMYPNITSSKDLYYKRIKIISRARGSLKPKIAVFGGDTK